MIEYKIAKTKEWNKGMVGFFDKADVREKEELDEQDKILR